MVNIYKWHARGVCPQCEWSAYAPFGDIFHIHITCCPRCGCKKYDGPSLRAAYQTLRVWKVRIMRRVGTSKFLSPSTWGTGYWETREQSKEEKI